MRREVGVIENLKPAQEEKNKGYLKEVGSEKDVPSKGKLSF